MGKTMGRRSRRQLIQAMSEWKLTEPMIKQFIDKLYKPSELRVLINHAVKRLKELESK
jgi:hypothetical protein